MRFSGQIKRSSHNPGLCEPGSSPRGRSGGAFFAPEGGTQNRVGLTIAEANLALYNSDVVTGPNWGSLRKGGDIIL